jgi:hypothetical protein
MDLHGLSHGWLYCFYFLIINFFSIIRGLTCAGAHGTSAVSPMKKNWPASPPSCSFPKFQDCISLYSSILQLGKLNRIHDIILQNYVLSEGANVSEFWKNPIILLKKLN